MKAKKENKVYDISETDKARYLQHGYSIYDDKDKLVEQSKDSMSAEEYKRLKEELEKAKAENKALAEELEKAKAELAKK